MDDANSNTQQARTLIAGGFADFLDYLVTLPNPIVVGDTYPRKRLYDAFREWSQDIGFNALEADVQLWRAACQHGFFRKE